MNVWHCANNQHFFFTLHVSHAERGGRKAEKRQSWLSFRGKVHLAAKYETTVFCIFCRFQDEISQREEAEANMQSFRQVRHTADITKNYFCFNFQV